MPSYSRRDLLLQAGAGFGSVALASLLAEESEGQSLPTKRKAAKAVIFLYMVGGPSQMETFDPKPELERLQGQPMPASFGSTIKSQFLKAGTPIMPSAWRFEKRGQSGLDVSDLFPHIATCADDLAVIRSCVSDSFVHAPAMYQIMSGRTTMGHPSLGSWVTYGLGSTTKNLPAFCVLPQPEGLPEGGSPMWDSAYLPAVHQGTILRSGASPILHLKPPEGMSKARQRHLLDYVKEMNMRSLTPDEGDLSARIASYELAFRMQSSAPEAIDIRKESAATKSLYGLDDPKSAEFGTRCLLARRLVERGVRFVQLFSGGGPVSVQWDAHDNIPENHGKMASMTDKPIAGLLKDLKSRGLLESTLVIWGSEFGRTPVSQNGKGRDHNPYGFSMWMAGGGVKAGTVYGATDEIGYRAVQNPVPIRDIHATILHLLGMNHRQLSVLHNGRQERLTDFAGQVIDKLVS